MKKYCLFEIIHIFYANKADVFYSFNFVLFEIQNSLIHLASIFGLNFQDGLFLNDNFWKTFWIIFQIFLQTSRKSGNPRADLHGVGEVIDFDSWIFLVQTRSSFLADLKSITLFKQLQFAFTFKTRIT